MQTGKSWSAAHGFGVLAVDHGAAVAEGPAGAAGALVADEAVLDAEPVVRERFFVEEVAELVVELLVLVVGDLEHAVLDAEGVVVVLAEFDSRRSWGSSRSGPCR